QIEQRDFQGELVELEAPAEAKAGATHEVAAGDAAVAELEEEHVVSGYAARHHLLGGRVVARHGPWIAGLLSGQKRCHELLVHQRQLVELGGAAFAISLRSVEIDADRRAELDVIDGVRGGAALLL